MRLHRRTESAGPRSFRLPLPAAVLEEYVIPALDCCFSQESGTLDRAHSVPQPSVQYDQSTGNIKTMYARFCIVFSIVTALLLRVGTFTLCRLTFSGTRQGVERFFDHASIIKQVPYTWRVFYPAALAADGGRFGPDPSKMGVGLLRHTAAQELPGGRPDTLLRSDPDIFKPRWVLAALLNAHRLHAPPRDLRQSHPSIRAFTYVDIRVADPPRPYKVIVKLPVSGVGSCIIFTFTVGGFRRTALGDWNPMVL